MGIRYDHVTFRYNGRQEAALNDIHLRLGAGSFIVLSGSPGSGKSTLLQLMNGILRPTEGVVHVRDFRIAAGETLRRSNDLRRTASLVFQFPERQLFEATVRDDICFGPVNFGVSREEAAITAKRVCKLLGLDEAILDASPFALSGGQMRKVAIGAALAADPDILVLDEPTASLDPAGREELLRLFRRLCDEEGKTIILATHRLEEVLPFADEYVLLREGSVIFQGDALQLWTDAANVEEAGVIVPAPLRMLARFAEHHQAALPNPIRHALSVDGLADYMSDILARRYADARYHAVGQICG